MKRIRGIAISLVIALAAMMVGSTASSQIDIHVHPEHRARHHIVHHPRNRVNVRVDVPVHRRVVRHHDERRAHLRIEEHHENH